MMPAVLAPLAQASRARAALLRRDPPQAARRSPGRFAAALRRADRIAVIAEVKRASPSEGPIRPGADPADLARALAAADALSVLTEPTRFAGSLADLAQVRSAVSLPILRKDFLVDPVQVDEAAAAGADAVLLILRMLPDAESRAMLVRAQALGLDVLAETHTDGEARRALDLGARIIGVNARDLDTLQVDLPRALALLSSVPASALRVIESGLSRAEDLRRAREAGADAALVGTALMRAADPAQALAELMP